MTSHQMFAEIIDHYHSVRFLNREITIKPNSTTTQFEHVEILKNSDITSRYTVWYNVTQIHYKLKLTKLN